MYGRIQEGSNIVRTTPSQFFFSRIHPENNNCYKINQHSSKNCLNYSQKTGYVPSLLTDSQNKNTIPPSIHFNVPKINYHRKKGKTIQNVLTFIVRSSCNCKYRMINFLIFIDLCFVKCFLEE